MRISRLRPASPSRSTPSAASAECSSPLCSCRSRRVVGRHRRRTSCGWRCSTARSFRRWPRRRPSGVLRALDRFDLISWQSTATPITRAILVAIAYATRRALPGLCCRSGTSPTLARRSLLLVPRLARTAPTRIARRNPADLRAGQPARRVAVRDPCQPHGQRAGRLGADRTARRRRSARTSRRGAVPRRLGLSDSAQPSPPTCSPRPSIRKSCGWTCPARSRGS